MALKEKLSSFKNIILPSWFISSPFVSSFYYFLVSKRFRREAHAVLNGRVKHLKDLENNKSNEYMLIRNIHRIEKGLLMRPRRGVFALGFLEETVDAYVGFNSGSNSKNEEQNKWFVDVLDEYFSVTESHPLINKQEEKYKTVLIEESNIGNEGKFIPYERNVVDMPNIDYEDFLKLTRYRRSVRWFQDVDVPRDLIDKAIVAALQSPSACNRQPFEYVIIDDKEMLKKAVKIPMGTAGYEKGIPAMVVVVGNLDAYYHERDRHVMYIDASLANMSFMFALETLGLSSCSINWPDFEELEQKMDNLLGLEKYQRPIMCMAIGYPDPEGKVAFSAKRDIENFRRYN